MVVVYGSKEGSGTTTSSPGSSECADEERDDLVAPVAEDELGGREPERLGHGLGERGRAAVGVEMDAGGLPPDRRDRER